MMNLHQDYREFIELLNAKEVEYLVVGAFALGLHGHPRYTGDIDFWINNSAGNAAKIFEVISDFGFPMTELKEDDFTESDLIFQMGYPPVRINVITSVDGLEFEESYKNRETKVLDGLKVDFINLNDFKKNKKKAGRSKDLADLEGLE